MGHKAVVFPNKRAALFLNQAIARLSDKPVWSPAYITISDLFRQHSDLTVADPVETIAILHKSYTTITGSDEDLDKFFSWGQLLLADFDDLDKNMGDADKIFQNLSDLHEMDDLSYLDEQQVEQIKRFFSNFTSDKTELEKRFLRVWDKMADVYHDFKKRLRDKGLAYEGMLYRDVVDQGNIPYLYDKYIFVGFNVLQKVEQRLFFDLKKKGKALFYWDYDYYYTKSNNEAGHYIRQWLDKFPNELHNDDEEIYDNFTKPKAINFVASPTENLQARYISTWLLENDRYKAGPRTAIVMCDEGLLQTIIHCIPGEVKSLNVTTGFPLKQTPVASLVMQLLNLQLKGWDDKRKAFRLHYVNAVLRHSYARFISEQSQSLLSKINPKHQFYLKPESLANDDELAQVFIRDGIEVEAEERPDRFDLAKITTWLAAIVRRVAVNGADSSDPLFQESCFRMYKLLNNLTALISKEEDDGTTIGGSINIYTFQHLLTQIINSTSVPFHGEPVEGVQVMGVLETRNLDFDHILILSCNEGNMPKGVDDTSFIPHALRSAYGLTTVNNKVAVYSYYFYSMLQRASDVTICYNNSTEGLNPGEMSRFMLQLLVELPESRKIGRLALQAGQLPLPVKPEEVVKDEKVMSRLASIKKLSPTAINTYIGCPMKFFYSYVAGIKEDDQQDEDEIDNRVFGNIFHRAAELLYSQPQLKLHTIINIAFNEQLFNLPEMTADEPMLNGMQLINRSVITKYVKMLKELDEKLGKFEVIGHETDVEMQLQLKSRTIKVGGRIDRLDRINVGEANEHLRVVDYKTGAKEVGSFKEVADLFNPVNIKKHSDYMLQAMLYSIIVKENDSEHNPKHMPVSPALLFIQRGKKKDYDPTLQLDKQPITDIKEYRDEFIEKLKEKLDEIFNPEIPFSITDNTDTCKLCPYAMMCRQ